MRLLNNCLVGGEEARRRADRASPDIAADGQQCFRVVDRLLYDFNCCLGTTSTDELRMVYSWIVRMTSEEEWSEIVEFGATR